MPFAPFLFCCYHIDMTTVTIPKQLAERGDLVLIPREEYETLLRFRVKKINEVLMAPIQRQALVRARANISRNKFLTLHELKRKLDFKN